MSSKNFRRLTVALALAALVTLLPSAALARPQAGPAGGPASLATDLIDALAQLWNGLARAWGAGDEGMLIDPDGANGTSEGDDDAGMMIDPNGTEGEGDNGMTIDPNG